MSCHEFVPQNYLWIASDSDLPTERLERRYQHQQGQIVLDTLPGQSPGAPETISPQVMAYLGLAHHLQTVPQPYALLESGNKSMLLLQGAAITAQPGKQGPQLLPTLLSSWSQASPLRQLNWLSQIATLWPDFVSHQVAQSLLTGEHLRVEHSTLRLLELVEDKRELNLVDLGQNWQSLISTAHESLRPFLDSLCQLLIQHKIAAIEQLLALLDRAVIAAAKGYRLRHELAILTDQGPSRQRNEDACYPTSGSGQSRQISPEQPAAPLLMIVCDGIGGHEGGDLASRIAIAAVQRHLTSTSPTAFLDSETTATILSQAISAANDDIAQRNDGDHRQARDRMGTTIVLILVVGAQAYIAHVGDSRAYRISPVSCRQITFDDDVASREVRLGYGFYADLIHRPGTGALVQALGMAHSSALHVSVQRVILDEDSVFLLCSDGLSDHERVDQFWTSELLPMLQGQMEVSTAARDLVKLANTYNGHDNVTVGIVRTQVSQEKPVAVPEPDLAALEAAPPPVVANWNYPPTAAPSENSTRGLGVEERSGFPWLMLLGIVGLLGLGTAAVMFMLDPFGNSGSTLNLPPNVAPSTPEILPGEAEAAFNGTSPAEDGEAAPELFPGVYLTVLKDTAVADAPNDAARTDTGAENLLQAGALVQVLTQQETAGQNRWIKVQVCILGASPSSPEEQDGSGISTAVLPSGAVGWITAAQLAQIARTAETQPSRCVP